MRLDRAEELLEPVVAPVLAEIARIVPEVPPTMVVGAVARDALHAGWGHRFPLRRTSDLDLALAVPDRRSFDRLVLGLRRIESSSGIRYRIAGTVVDLVPFGRIENPDGVISSGRGSEPMSVFGFADACESGHELQLAGHPVRLPTAAGYAVLKLKAWADRSVAGQYKDAEVVAAVEFDHARAANRLLIADGLELLPDARSSELSLVWGDVDDLLLADQLRNPALPGWGSPRPARALEFVQDLREALSRRG